MCMLNFLIAVFSVCIINIYKLQEMRELSFFCTPAAYITRSLTYTITCTHTAEYRDYDRIVATCVGAQRDAKFELRLFVERRLIDARNWRVSVIAATSWNYSNFSSKRARARQTYAMIEARAFESDFCSDSW